MNKKIKVVLLGAGNRADIYASVSLTHPDKMEVVGIVDPDPVRRKLMKEKYNVSDENCFEDVAEFVKKDRFADAVINGTMDHLHVPTSIPVLEKGYDMLLEKPFATNENEMNDLFEVAKKNNSKIVIGHVLRYTDFYKAIKNELISGEIGNIISIEMCEHVNYHHMAVSYVRGKWRSEKVCFAPMILAKSCHDVDIMLWMMKETSPVSVASFGSDFQFGKDRKPSNAGKRCMIDCPLSNECKFSAKSNYLDVSRWNHYVWKEIEGDGVLTDEIKEEFMSRRSEYGRCVWDFERDGNVDHQTLIVNFENGATGTFSMIGGSARSERNIHIIGTNGEIKGTFEDSRYVVRKMNPSIKSGYEERVCDLKEAGDKIGIKGGHGGGDRALVHDFIDYLNNGNISVSCATIADSVISHLTVFKAEEARKENKIVNIKA